MGFMQHASGLLVAPVVDILALPFGQNVKRSTHQVRGDGCCLPSHGQRVAAEQAEGGQIPFALFESADHGRGKRAALAAAEDRSLVEENLRAAIIFARSEEHTSELQSRFGISYAVFFLK